MIRPLNNYYLTSVCKQVGKKNLVMSNPELAMTIFSPRATFLIKNIDKLIGDTWTYIKKNNQPLVSPEFTLNTRECNVNVKALYRTNKEDSILFDISEKNSRILERFIIDRKAQNYTYEKILKTEHGSATVKTYDSKTAQDCDIDNKLNNYIEEFFPKILIRNRKLMR